MIAIRQGDVNFDRITELSKEVERNGRDLEKMIELVGLITPLFEIYIKWLDSQIEQGQAQNDDPQSQVS